MAAGDSPALLFFADSTFQASPSTRSSDRSASARFNTFAASR